MKKFAITLYFWCLIFLGLIAADVGAQTNLCDLVPQQSTCSFTSINDNCQVNVDRTNAISSPTIYMKPGAKLKVVVYNVSPFETLTLDLTSLTAALRPDAIQTVFNSLTPNASKATGLTIQTFPLLRLAAGPPPAQSLDDLLKSERTAFYAQNHVIDETDASLVLQQIGLVAQAPTSQSCFLTVDTTTDEFPNPWFQTDAWKAVVVQRLKIASDGTAKTAADILADAQPVQDQINGIADSVQQWNDYTDPNRSGFHKLDPADRQKLDTANQNLNTLKVQQFALVGDQKHPGKITIRGDNGDANHEQDRLNALSGAIASISTAPTNSAQTPAGTQNSVNQFVINVPNSGKAFNVSGVWALNYTNVLSNAITQVTQATFPPQGGTLGASYVQLGSPATKTQAMSITIQSTNREWVEASAGFVVPWRAYHSYTAAAQASGGSVVNNVVQQTLTHTVVPAAFVNINLLEIPNRRGSWAFFLTPFVGYNNTTSAVETGIGPSISWRSIELNLMADYANDTYLSGGFTVGQSLGASNPASPLTANAYSWRFAPGISIRVPLGSSTAPPATAGPTGGGSASPANSTKGGGGKHH